MSQADSASPPDAGRLVVVEDDPGVARLEQRELSRRGYRVQVVHDADEALALPDLADVECWLIDQSLSSERTGLDLVDDLRQRGAHAPVVLVTGNDDPEVLLLALRAGVRDFVRKGQGFLELLVSRVDAVLKAERAERDLQISRSMAAIESSRRRELEEEITERRRAEALAQEALHRLSENDRRKDEFLAMLGHELRNPLAPIGSAVEVLRLEAADPSRVEWAAGVIGRQLDQMRRLVDDLLDVGRIMNSGFALKSDLVEVRRILEHATERATPLVEERRQQLVCNFDDRRLCVRGDEVRLIQAVANLLDNASKYTPPEGRIELQSTQIGDALEILVRDNGVGLNADEIDAIFDLFVQGERTPDRAEGGLGLGLALVRRIMKLHGGAVMATSDGPGRGSTFVMRLPLADAEPESVVEEVAPAARAGGRVLIVDDNVDAAEALATLLRLWGFEVAAAHDGAAAIDAILELQPGAVLLDIGLPGLDGYGVKQELEARDARERLWVAVTGYGQRADRERTTAAGFDAHLSKPVDFAALRQALAPLLAQ
ncbi:MAG: response regulator [Planctomycetes bacterium]|nr:response regulator [Planctomycetota bacterium]